MSDMCLCLLSDETFLDWTGCCFDSLMIAVFYDIS